MSRKSRGLLHRRPDMLAGLQEEATEPELEPIRLPAVVGEAALFDVDPDAPRVLFDLSQTTVLEKDATRGLIRAARSVEVLLRVPPGPVLDKLHTLFAQSLRFCAPYWSLRL